MTTILHFELKINYINAYFHKLEKSFTVNY